MKEDYNFSRIEKKWQKTWEEQGVFTFCADPQKKKYYCLEMYPYPSGRIHMGQVRNYAIGDVIARFKMMTGLNIIHPIGWMHWECPIGIQACPNGSKPGPKLRSSDLGITRHKMSDNQ